MIELTDSRRAADPEGAPVTGRVVPPPSASIVASAVPVVVAVPPEFPEVLGHAREVRDHLLWAFLRSAYIYQMEVMISFFLTRGMKLVMVNYQ